MPLAPIAPIYVQPPALTAPAKPISTLFIFAKPALATVKTGLVKPTDTPKMLALEFRETPVRDAFATLFNFAKVKYTLSESVTGTIHLKITQVSWEDSLQLLCRNNTPRLLCRKEGDTYIIEPRPDSTPVEIMTLRQPISTLPLTQKITPVKAIKGQKLDDRRVSMDIQNAPVREVLTAFFDTFDLDFIISPEVSGTVSTTCDNVPFDQALRQILCSSSVAVTYSRDGKRFSVRTRVPVVIDNTEKEQTEKEQTEKVKM